MRRRNEKPILQSHWRQHRLLSRGNTMTLNLGFKMCPGLQRQSYGLHFISAEHGPNTSLSPVYAIVRKTDKFSISATFSHGKVNHFKGWKGVWFLEVAGHVSLKSQSPDILLLAYKLYCLKALLTLIAALSTFDFIQGAKCHSLVRGVTL